MTKAEEFSKRISEALARAKDPEFQKAISEKYKHLPTKVVCPEPDPCESCGRVMYAGFCCQFSKDKYRKKYD